MSKPIVTLLSGTSRKATTSARLCDIPSRISMILPRSKKFRGAPGGESTSVTFHPSDLNVVSISRRKHARSKTPYGGMVERKMDSTDQ